MAPWLPTSPKDLTALISSKLNVNPLVLSLFAISPADAVDYLGIKNIGGWLDLHRATSTDDRAQVTLILDSLRAGRTALDTTQQVTTNDAADPLLADLILTPTATTSTHNAVPERARDHAAIRRPAPDITLTVARTTLQYAVRLYAQHQFIGQSFHIAPQPWLQAEARGVAIAIELAEGNARIIASFDATFTGSAKVAHRRFTLFTKRSPIEINLSALFSVNAAGQLCIGVGPGMVHVPGLPLPSAVIKTLYQHVQQAVSAIPIVYLPTRLDVPGASEVIPDDIQVQLSHIEVTEQALTLEFQLFVGPSANPM